MSRWGVQDQNRSEDGRRVGGIELLFGCTTGKDRGLASHPGEEWARIHCHSSLEVDVGGPPLHDQGILTLTHPQLAFAHIPGLSWGGNFTLHLPPKLPISSEV